MTLVITELSNLGIAMVSDTAITRTGGTSTNARVTNVMYGIQKLQWIPTLGAGISMWGAGSVLSDMHSDTDLWLYMFDTRVHTATSLEEWADCLTDALNNEIRSPTEALGFHVGGYETINELKLPVFYEVRNTTPGTYDPILPSFTRYNTFGPQLLPPDDPYRVFTEGDPIPFEVIAGALYQAQGVLREKGLQVPPTSLRGRLRYYQACVRFLSDLYSCSGRLRSIGAEVRMLGLQPNGRVTTNFLQSYEEEDGELHLCDAWTTDSINIYE
jgi:hypothetical protein